MRLPIEEWIVKRGATVTRSEKINAGELLHVKCNGKHFLVIRFGNDGEYGWEVFKPLHTSNDVRLNLKALDRYTKTGLFEVKGNKKKEKTL